MRLRLVQLAELEKPTVHEIDLSRSATGRHVRERAAEFAKVPIERIRLYRRGVELSDDAHLCTVLDDNADCLVFTVESARSPQLAALRVCGLESLARVETAALRTIRELLDDARAGLAAGQQPVLSEDGSGGTYFLKDASGSYVACFKPRDEEPAAENNPRGLLGRIGQCGLRQGVRAGEAVQREVAAFITDFDGFSGVPETILVEAKHSAFHYRDGDVRHKTGSFQRYVPADCIASDLSPNLFPVEQVHKIALLDIRMLNSDRNDANLLVTRRPKPRSPGAMPAAVPRSAGGGDLDGASQTRKLRSLSCSMGPMDFDYYLTPIDHGYCLPDKLEVAWCDWCWLDWPQARVPFSPATLRWIEDYDVDTCIKILQRDLNVRARCLRLMRIVAMVLKKGARAGLCLHDIASIIARQDVDRPSVLETQVTRAQELARMMHSNARVKGVAAAHGALESDLSSSPCSSPSAASPSPRLRAGQASSPSPRDERSPPTSPANASSARRDMSMRNQTYQQQQLRHARQAKRDPKSRLEYLRKRRVATLSSCNLPCPGALFADAGHTRPIFGGAPRPGKENSRLGLPRMSAPSYEDLQNARRSPDPADDALAAVLPDNDPGITCGPSPQHPGEAMMERFFFEYIERLIDDVILCVHNHRRLDQTSLFRRTTSMHLTSPHRQVNILDLLEEAQQVDRARDNVADRRPRCASDDSFFPGTGLLAHHQDPQRAPLQADARCAPLPLPPHVLRRHQGFQQYHKPCANERGGEEINNKGLVFDMGEDAVSGICLDDLEDDAFVHGCVEEDKQEDKLEDPPRIVRSSLLPQRVDRKPAPLDISLADPGLPHCVRVDTLGTKLDAFATSSFHESKVSMPTKFASSSSLSTSPSPVTASPPDRRSGSPASSPVSQKHRIPLHFLPI